MDNNLDYPEVPQETEEEMKRVTDTCLTCADISSSREMIEDDLRQNVTLDNESDSSYCRSLEIELNSLDRALDKMYLSMCASDAQIKRLSALHRDQEEKIKTLQSQNHQQDVEIQRLNEIIRTLESKVKAHQQTTSALKSSSEEEENDINSIKEKFKKKQHMFLAQIEELTRDKKRLQSLLLKTDGEVCELQVHLMFQESKNEQLREEHEKVMALAIAVEKDKSEFLAQIEALTEDDTRLQSIIKKTETEQVSLKERINETSYLPKSEIQQLKESWRPAEPMAEEDVLKKKLDEIKTLHSEEVKKNQTLGSENGRQKIEIQEIKEYLRRREEEYLKNISELEKSLDVTKESLNNERVENGRLQSIIENKESDQFDEQEKQRLLARIEELSKNNDMLLSVVNQSGNGLQGMNILSKFQAITESSAKQNDKLKGNGQDDGSGASWNWTKGLLFAGGCAAATGAFMKFGPKLY